MERTVRFIMLLLANDTILFGQAARADAQHVAFSVPHALWFRRDDDDQQQFRHMEHMQKSVGLLDDVCSSLASRLLAAFAIDPPTRAVLPSAVFACMQLSGLITNAPGDFSIVEVQRAIRLAVAAKYSMSLTSFVIACKGGDMEHATTLWEHFIAVLGLILCISTFFEL